MAVQRDKVIASAEKLVAKGKIEPAIKEYERLLEDNPNDVNTLNRIGDLWVRINRNDEAVKVFVKIADHYSKDGFFLKAIAIYKKINKLDPSRLDIYSRLADLYAKQGLAMEAKSQYQVLADYYMKHGEPANALGIYKKISDLDPQAINVHVKLADLYSQNNQTAEALKEYDRVGRMLLKRGMLDEAVQVFRKALKVDPKNTELVDSLVTALVEAKDFDNARQIVEVALETNREDARLLALMGRIQLGRGETAAALATLERVIAANPDSIPVRESLAEIYLRQNDADRALEMVAPLAEKALGRGERGTALEMLNRIIRVEPGHAPTLERLVAMYSRLNEETNVLSAMNSLAEAHMARAQFEQASKVLEKLIDREPQNAQHRTKLQFVRAQMGDNDTLPPGTRVADTSTPELPAMEIEEPAPTFDISGAEESFSLDLDASEPLELDLSTLPPVASPEPPRSAATPGLRPAVEQAAEALDGDEDLDFITEHLTEAEVFAKYGLAEKAIEHLRAVLERSPRNVAANERLFRVYLEEGDVQNARTAAQAFVAILNEESNATAIEAVTNEFVTRGHHFEPAAPPKPERRITAEQPAPPVAAEPEISLDDFAPSAGELSFDLESAPEIEFELEQPELEMETQPSAESLVEPLPEPEPMLEIEEELELPEVELPEPEPRIEPEAAEPTFEFTLDEPVALPEPELESILEETAAATGETFGELSVEDELSDVDRLAAEPAIEKLPTLEATDALFQPAPLEPAWEPVESLDIEEGIEIDVEPEPIEASPAAFEPVSAGITGEELAEVDFYIEQELLDEARGKLDSLAARHPDHPEVVARIARLASMAAAAPVTPPALSRDEIETELLSAIPDDGDEFIAPPPAAPSPAIQAAAVAEENLFADEDSFFDLAAELESELAEEDEAFSLSEEEQSLEEIFKEFKKGVEQQLDSEDYDTHYNLGIAYKEMGLIDEAIGEFQLASKDPKRAIECASMLGLCFLEKGMPQLAIKWYLKGLEMPEISQDEHIGLLYDLASAHQEVGDTEAAQKAFMEVYGMNSNYRDIVSRIKQLEDAQR
jgi:pilus assembly protein FimV